MNVNLDELIAEKVMGWHVGSGCNGLHPPDATTCVLPQIPDYTTDERDTRLVEDEIASRGLIEQYVFTLGSIVASPDLFDEDPLYQWALIRATPKDRCLAALKILGIEV